MGHDDSQQTLPRTAGAAVALAEGAPAPSAGPRPRVSIVIPVYNESENLRDLVAQVKAAMDAQPRSYELLLVDDGSRDDSRAILRELAAQNAWLRPLMLIRNYGQSTALQAGFDHAAGDYIVTLDGDLQNDPVEIPRLLAMLDERPDVDAVSGWRKERHDKALTRKLPSWIANALISKVTGVHLHDYGCALKAYRREVIDNVRLYGEMHRFIPALAVEAGARVIEVPVLHHPRLRGQSKYGLSRILRVALDLMWVKFLMRFLQRPLHAFGGVGMGLLVPGMLLLGWLGFEKVALGASIGGRPLLMLAVLLVLMGVQLVATGVLGELLTRVYHEPEGRRQYGLRQPAADSER